MANVFPEPEEAVGGRYDVEARGPIVSVISFPNRALRPVISGLPAEDSWWTFSLLITNLPGLRLGLDEIVQHQRHFERLFQSGMRFMVKLYVRFLVEDSDGLLSIRGATIVIVEYEAVMAGRMATFMSLVRDLNARIDEWLESNQRRDEQSGITYIRIFEARIDVVGEQRLRRIFGEMPAQPAVPLRMPLAGGAYVKLPQEIEAKCCIINPQTGDLNCCFRISAVMHKLGYYLKPKDGGRSHPHRLNHYKRPEFRSSGGPRPRVDYDDARVKAEFLDAGLDFGMIDEGLPTPLEVIPQFEEANQLNVAVYSCHFAEDGTVAVIRLYVNSEKRYQGQPLVLFLHDGHYSLVTNFNALMGCQGEATRALAMGDTSRRKNAGCCEFCMRSFADPKRLLEHRIRGLCTRQPLNRKREYVLPAEKVLEDGTVILPSMRFKDPQMLHKLPCFVVADAEAYFTAAADGQGKHAGSNDRACSMGWYAVAEKGLHLPPELRQGMIVDTPESPEEHVTERFVLRMLSLANAAYEAANVHRDPPKTSELSFQDRANFGGAQHCYACRRRFGPKVKKVLDHDHLTGAYRGAACATCNGKMKVPRTLVVLFHNLQGYDGHLLVRAIMNLLDKNQPWHSMKLSVFDPELPAASAARSDDDMDVCSDAGSYRTAFTGVSNLFDSEDDADSDRGFDDYDPVVDEEESEKIGDDSEDDDEPPPQQAPKKTSKDVTVGNLRFTVIKRSNEKYACLRFGRLLFLDSMAFIKGSLEKLVESHRKNNSDKTLKEAFPHWSGNHGLRSSPCFEDLLMKIPFPYSWLTDRSCFAHEGALPIERFRDDLHNEDCKPKRYETYLEILQKFGFRNFRDLHDAYLENDVLLLADVCAAFRDAFYIEHGVDPFQSMTLPSASMKALLRSLKKPIELISDSNGGMRLMVLVNQTLMGGLSSCLQPEAVANNPGCPGYNPDEPTSWLQYVDVNSLYPFAMSMALPEGDFKEVRELPDDSNLSEQLRWLYHVLDEYDDDSERGYLITVDYEVPDRLHDLKPLAPCVHTVVGNEELAPLQVRRRLFYNTVPSKKIVPHLGPQKHITRHIGFLKTLVRKVGIRITRIYKEDCWSFRQSRWLQPFIAKLAKKKAEATDEIVREVSKLAMNALYGKMCQNPQKYVNTRLIADPVKFQRAVWKTDMVDFNYISSGDDKPFLASVDSLPGGKATLNTPRIVGFTVLDHAKMVMYDFFYDYLMTQYGPERCILCFTDTDSFLCKIYTEDILEDMRNHHAAGLADFDLSGGSIDWPDGGKLGAFKWESVFKGDKARGLPKQTTFPWKFVGLQSKLYYIETSRPKIEDLAIRLKLHGHPREEHLAESLYKRPLTKEDAQELQYVGFEIFGTRKCKGTPNYVLQKKTLDDYLKASRETFLDCADPVNLRTVRKLRHLDPRMDKVEFKRIQTEHHEIKHTCVTKRCLTGNNDKVFLYELLAARPLGHWRNSRDVPRLHFEEALQLEKLKETESSASNGDL